MRRLGFLLGTALFLVIIFLPAPPGLSVPAKSAGAIAALMAVWWMTEAVPIAATALIPLALYPLLSILNAKDTAKVYADPNVFLFMGGFMLAMAMQKWNLHKRLALFVIYLVGGGPRRMLGGFMLATTCISMWVSNTATAVMILPIALAVIQKLSADATEAPAGNDFAVALMLGVAYASSIGGVATLIGSPPNMIFAGQSRSLFPELPEIGFMPWLVVSLPLAAGFLAIAWIYLAFLTMKNRGKHGQTDRQILRKEMEELGPVSRGEWGVMAVFFLAVFGWVFREDILLGSLHITGWQTWFGLKGIHDGTVAMTAALILFVTPVRFKKAEFLLDWEWAKKLPWEVLLLFGGGFALAESFQATGLAEWMGGGFASLGHWPLGATVLLVCLAVTFSSELMSNTAQVTLILPVLASASTVLGIHPYLLMYPATIAASLAFMLPAGTPPNAIVFGSGFLRISQMAKAGFWLNILGALWTSFVTLTLGRAVFGLQGSFLLP